MEQREIKRALIDSAIHTIAKVGIDSATTKLLANNAGVNEVYIYRIFGGKENLFKEAFVFVDNDFSATLLDLLPKAYSQNLTTEARFKNLFELVWKYATSDKEKCSFFIRYYYSRCYTSEISLERKAIYAAVMKKFDTAFERGTDTWWLFNHILDVVFSSAVKVLRDEIPDNEETQENIFNLLYPAIKQYFKN